MTIVLLEWVGFMSGVACAWLMVKRRVATWPIGLVNSASWLLLLWLSQLYLNSLLQIAYLGLGVYGWLEWVRADGEADELRVRRLESAEVPALLAYVVVVTATLTWITISATDSVSPFWDALTTVVSVAAMYLQAKKVYEGWYLWIGVDVVYLVLYSSQHLYLTALTQVVFGAMCIVGLREWRAAMRPQLAVEAT
jgi:nicotinamide mononucleotide transporter